MSSSTSVQKRKSLETKRKIINAFIELLGEKDFSEISTREICARAGVSNGSFFHHFKEKSALLSSYMELSYENYQTQEDTGSITNPYLAFLKQDEWSNRFSLQFGINFMVNYYTPSNRVVATHGDETTIMNRTSDFMSDTYEAAKLLVMDQDVQPGLIPEQIETDYHTIRHGAIFDWCACGGSFDLSKTTRRLLVTYFRGISTEKGLALLSEAETAF